MLSWEDFTNIVHHHLWERRGAKWAARYRRCLERWRDRAKDGRPALLPQARRPKEERMPDVESPAVPLVAKGQLLLASVDAETAQALRAAITEELLGLVKDEAVFEARQALTEEFERLKARWLDDLQAEREQMAKDCTAVERAAWEQQLAVEQEAYTEHLDQVRTRLRDWRGRAEVAEGLVVSVLTQLTGGVDGDPVYLRSIGSEGLSELDRHATNAVLGRHGLVLKSKANASRRTVAVTLEPGKIEPHSLFWLTKAPVPGVVDADADAADAI